MVKFMQMQRRLQIGMREANPTQGGDPFKMTPDELAQFVTWNHTALIAELGEMLDEVGWKPWASSRHCNGDAALREMVDAFHFFLNILLAIAAWDGLYTDKEAAEYFEAYYREKNAKNLERQKEGYDGVTGKCGSCHRELSEVLRLNQVTCNRGGVLTQYCNIKCHFTDHLTAEEGEVPDAR